MPQYTYDQYSEASKSHKFSGRKNTMTQSNDKDLRAYKRMLLIRKLEEAISKKYHDGNMRCPVHLSVGQEACAVGICEVLSEEDKVILSHRSHAGYVARGGNLKKMLMEILGKQGGCCDGRGGSMHLFDDTVGVIASVPIVGSGIPLATGVGFSLKYRSSKAIAVAFFGDAAVEEGAYYEALNFAQLKRLPILFACENNEYSVYTHLEERQSGDELTKVAAALNIPTKRCDGNDFNKVKKCASELIDHVRSGNGPAFIQMDTYRWLEHCGPNNDDHLNYRNKDKVDHWLKHCPIKLLRERLLSADILTEETERKLISNIESEIYQAFLAAENAPFPEYSGIGSHVYA